MTYNLRNRTNTIATELTITNNIQYNSFFVLPFILERGIKRSSGCNASCTFAASVTELYNAQGDSFKHLWEIK